MTDLFAKARFVVYHRTRFPVLIPQQSTAARFFALPNFAVWRLSLNFATDNAILLTKVHPLMRRIHILSILIFAFLLSATGLCAQTQKARKDTINQITAIAKQYADSLQQLSAHFAHWHYNGADTLSNPYFAPIYTASTYHHFPVHELIGQLSFAPEAEKQPRNQDLEMRRNMMNRAIAGIYKESPWLISRMPEEGPRAAIPEKNKEVRPQVKLSENLAPVEQDFINPDFDIEVRRPNFWTIKTNFSFQLMQYYVSDNWYKGGESNHSLLGNLVVQANYNNKTKVTFNNKLEMKLGFQSSHSDDVHRYKTNADLLRLTNDFGLKASTHWYYSAMLQSWTQFCRGYRKNDHKVYSDFMSPFESLLTLGMKYTLTSKNKKFSINANLSPFACDFKYVSRRALETTYGLKEDRHTKFDYGSNITLTHSWTVFKNVTWSGRFYYYTNYKKTQIEWENTIKLTVNKYLSTQLFLYPRFDDGTSRSDPNDSYFQFKEQLSVGLDLTF